MYFLLILDILIPNESLKCEHKREDRKTVSISVHFFILTYSEVTVMIQYYVTTMQKESEFAETCITFDIFNITHIENRLFCMFLFSILNPLNQW